MGDKIMYRDLDIVPLQLGFKKRSENGHVFYEESVHDAVISLPNRQPDEPVLARHYVAAWLVVDGKGIVEKLQFDALLTELTQGTLPVTA